MSYNFQPTGALSCDFGSVETTTLESYTTTTTTTSTTTTTTSTTTADNSWYIFVAPDDFEVIDYDDEAFYIDLGGQAHKFSKLCNPDWVASDGYNCERTASGGHCSDPVKYIVLYATENADGIWETGLQCPQCGCGEDGAVNLNDLYAENGDRTVPNRRPRKNL